MIIHFYKSNNLFAIGWPIVSSIGIKDMVGIFLIATSSPPVLQPFVHYYVCIVQNLRINYLSWSTLPYFKISQKVFANEFGFSSGSADEYKKFLVRNCNEMVFSINL